VVAELRGLRAVGVEPRHDAHGRGGAPPLAPLRPKARERSAPGHRRRTSLATAAARPCHRPLPPPPHPDRYCCHERGVREVTRTRAGPVRLAYQPPASSTFLSQQTSHQYFSLKTNQHQPPAKRTG
jgi:hypothetical protein